MQFCLQHYFSHSQRCYNLYYMHIYAHTFQIWYTIPSIAMRKYGYSVEYCYQSINQITWRRHQMETFCAVTALCVGNSPVTGEFPSQRPVTRSFDIFFDLGLNKRLSKQQQSKRRWFETPWRSLWRHRNEMRLSSTDCLVHIQCNIKASHYSASCPMFSTHRRPLIRRCFSRDSIVMVSLQEYNHDPQSNYRSHVMDGLISLSAEINPDESIRNPYTSSYIVVGTNGCLFADDIFKRIVWNIDIRDLIWISLKSVARGPN